MLKKFICVYGLIISLVIGYNLDISYGHGITGGSGLISAPAAGGGGSGDVSGPATSTDNAIPRWNGTDGELLQDSGVIINDSDFVGIGITPVVPLHVSRETSSGSAIATVIAIVSDTGSGTITAQEALTVRAGSQAGFSGTIDLAKGIDVRIDNPAGTLTDARAIQISASTGTIGIAYGIYQTGANDQNYFAGNVGFGTTSFGADFLGGIGFGNTTTAPTGVLADGVMMWADDFAADDSRLYIMSEASTDTVIIGDGDVILPATGRLYFDGGDDTYFYESSADIIRSMVGGASTFAFTTTAFQGGVSGSPAILNETAAATNPVYTFRSGTTYGLGGSPSSNFISLIANSIEGIRITEASSETLTEIKSNGVDTSPILEISNTGGDFQIFRDDASPEGVITGSIGDLCIDSTNGIIYIKNSGSASNTGWIALVESSTNLSEMILYNNSTEMTIDSDDKEHALRLFLTGDLNGFTFDAGSTGPIANTSDNSGTLRITDVAHGLVTGDIVTITGLSTEAQNDVTAVTRIDDDIFDCDDITFVTGSETGTWNQGSSLIAGSMTAGIYLTQLGISTISASVTPEITYHIYINTIQQQGDAIQFDLATSSGRGFMSQIVTIAAGDIIWVSALETGNNVNITNIFSNINLHRL